jgi:glycosyltransferase 2 family protein
MKFPLKTIAGICGLIIAIIYCIQGVNFKDIIKILRDMNHLQAIIVLCLTTFNLVIRAIVFKLIVNPIKRIPLTHALSSYLVGVFSNLFLPFKLGDVAQGYFLGRRQDISKISAVSAVFIQRIFEVTTLLVLMMIVALAFSIPLLVQRRTLIIGLLILIGIVLLIIAFNKKERVGAFVQKFLNRYSPSLAITVRQYVELFLQGTIAMNNPSRAIKITTLSILSWIVQIIMVKYTANALNISLDVVASCIVLFIVNIGLTVPIAPGNVGTFQFFGIIALSLFSVPKPQALLFSIIFQVIQGVPVIIGGGIILMREVLSKNRVLSVQPNEIKSVTK